MDAISIGVVTLAAKISRTRPRRRVTGGACEGNDE